METSSRILSLEQVTFNNIMGYASEFKCNEQTTVHLPASCQREVICPVPHRAAMISYVVETPSRSCYKFKRNWPSHRGDNSLDIHVFLGKNDFEDELDAASSQMSLLSCSPPVRTSNPLIHDVEFVRQASVIDPVSQNTQGGKYSSARANVPPNRGISSGEKPIVRIEGFACGGSKSHYISTFA